MAGMMTNIEERIFVLEFLLDALWANRISAVQDQEGALNYLRDGLKEIVALESSIDEARGKQLDSILDEHLVSIWRTLQSGQRRNF